MTDSRRYIFAPTLGPPHVYDLDAAGLTYHAPGDREVALRWDEIQYLEERPGQKVDIVADNPDRVVPVYFGTQHLGDLLDRLCSQLSVLHRDKKETLTFRATRSYFNHFSIVIGVLIAFLMAGVLFLNSFEPAMLLVLAITLPLGVSLVLQPIEVTAGENGLRVRDFCRQRRVPYGAIETLAFDVRGDLNFSFLRIILTTRNGQRIKITRFENMLLLFIMIKAHRHPNVGHDRMVDGS